MQPLALEYLPAAQFTQLDAPALVDKDPEGHCVHTEEEIAPTAVEYMPAAQPTQLVWPELI